MRTLLLLLFAVPCFASGPKYVFDDPKLNDELDNVYHDIGNVLKGSSTTVRFINGSSMTLTGTFTAKSILGNATGTAACVGCIGEIIRASNNGNNAFATTNTYGDATSISLTPGLWAISAIIRTNANGATVASIEMGVSTTSGDSGTGLTSGLNHLILNGAASFTFNPVLTLPSYYVTVAATTTFYLKVWGTYITATPLYQYSITAIRIG